MKILNFYGIKFYDVDYKTCLDLLKKKGGYLVIPAASSLATIKFNKKYYLAHKKSTIAIFDSVLFCFSLLFFKNKFFKKFSGYKFMKFFIVDKDIKNKKILLLNPSAQEARCNIKYLKKKKFKFIMSYVCPVYNKKTLSSDLLLFKKINKYKPEIILINIAGGTQEILALSIKNNVRVKTICICSGAALTFLTGQGAKISDLIDKFYLGWFMRILNNPKIFIIRILKSIKLVPLVVNSKIHVLLK